MKEEIEEIDDNYIKLGEDKISLKTIIQFANIIYSYSKNGKPENGSLRANIIRLMGNFNEIEINKQEYATLFNISIENLRIHLKENFINFQNTKNDQIERTKSICDKQDVEHWIMNNTFSHYSKQQKISFDCMSHAFKKYKKVGTASLSIFEETWKNIHVRVSSHKRFDFYGCKKCHNHKLRAYNNHLQR